MGPRTQDRRASDIQVASRKARMRWLHFTTGIDEAGSETPKTWRFSPAGATPSSVKTWTGSAGTSLAKTRKSAASAKAGSRTVRSRGEQMQTTPVALVKKNTKKQRWKYPLCGSVAPLKSMRQLKCQHIMDWHPTERRMLKQTGFGNTTKGRRRGSAVAVPGMPRRVFIDPRSRIGRKARILHEGHPDTPAEIFRLVSAAQIGREWK